MPGPEFSAAQLTFAAAASLALYAVFVLTQTVRHRDFFLPVDAAGDVIAENGSGGTRAEAVQPDHATSASGLLLVALVAVVGLAKVESPAIEAGVAAVGFPASLRRSHHRRPGARAGNCWPRCAPHAGSGSRSA